MSILREDAIKLMSKEQYEKYKSGADNHFSRCIDGAYIAYKKNAKNVYIVGQTCGMQELYGKYIYVNYYIMDGKKIEASQNDDKKFKKVRCRFLEESDDMRFILVKVRPCRAIIKCDVRYYFEFIEITNKFDKKLIEGLELMDKAELLELPEPKQKAEISDSSDGDNENETKQQQQQPTPQFEGIITETEGDIYKDYK